MNLEELDKKGKLILSRLDQNKLTFEIIEELERVIELYGKFESEFLIEYSGQFYSSVHASLFLAYTSFFTVPVVISLGNKIIANGSGILMDVNREILVTNFHVYEEWANRRDQVNFSISGISLDNRLTVIDINKKLDIVTIDLNSKDVKALKEKHFKKFAVLNHSIKNLEAGSFVIISGFPGCIRSTESEYNILGHVSIGETVMDRTAMNYIISFDRNQWNKEFGHNSIQDLSSLGGLSGGPVFICMDNKLELVGMVFEDFGDLFDGLRVVRINLIEDKGKIDRTLGEY